MNIDIRLATEKDVPTILNIINHEIKNTTVVYDYNEKSLEAQLDWFHKKQQEGLPVLVAERDGDVLAYGTYGVFRTWDAYRFSVEHSIYVDDKARGLGIGQMMMQKLIDLARENGYHTMVAGIDSSNEGSLEFHKKFGFEEVGRIKEVGYKFDQWLDLVFMQLLL
ncbi:GNAT family N-acetyltransferase [Flammeovirgaceae bacterium SG7u.111]|nr:N-acetyltransferase family protein [Flammeovirgaceae bacterium SG7u.132]WPO36772.1 GNAT family N-acetyltransferase [Flammeovirgaceae bacterium SG7u.111]